MSTSDDNVTKRIRATVYWLAVSIGVVAFSVLFFQTATAIKPCSEVMNCPADLCTVVPGAFEIEASEWCYRATVGAVADRTGNVTLTEPMVGGDVWRGAGCTNRDKVLGWAASLPTTRFACVVCDNGLANYGRDQSCYPGMTFVAVVYGVLMLYFSVLFCGSLTQHCRERRQGYHPL